jgi:cytochrome c oxidase assembly factor CtaG
VGEILAAAVVASPPALLAVVAAGTAYAFGRERWHRTARRTMVGPVTAALFFGGLLVVAIALASPLDSASDTSLSAHMVQHVLLLSAAGPLLAFGMPLPTLLYALPDRARRRGVLLARRLARAHDRNFVAWVSAALLVEALVMWAWHIPVAYDAAIRNPPLHAIEHASFLLVSTAAWWAVVTGRRRYRGGAAIASLLGSLPGTVLGVAMVLAPNPWYPVYLRSGTAAALSSQQIAGVVMWAFGGMAAAIAGAALFASWLAHMPAEVAVQGSASRPLGALR